MPVAYCKTGSPAREGDRAEVGPQPIRSASRIVADTPLIIIKCS